MKAKIIIRKILYSSWFISLIPVIMVILIHPNYGMRYSMLISSGKNQEYKTAYSDLNSDSISEKILLFDNAPFHFVVVQNASERTYDQWNFADSIISNTYNISPPVFFGNYDHDSYQEIYVFTHNGDSLFLNINEFFDQGNKRKERIFIDRIAYSKNVVAASLMPAGFFDSNGDGLDEVYFSISSYSRLGPRKVYSCDIAGKTIVKSPESAIVPLWPELADVDMDQRPEIFGNMSSSGNYPLSAAFSDSSTWLMVFNDKLGFEFEPVEFPGCFHSLCIRAYNGGYLVTHNANGADTGLLRPSVMIYSSDGRLLKQRYLEDLGINSRAVSTLIFGNGQSDRILIAANRLVEINGLLEEVRSVDLPYSTAVNLYKNDINGDGKTELIIHSFEKGAVMIYSEELRLLSNQEIHLSGHRWQISNRHLGDGQNDIFVDAVTDTFFIKLEHNRFYFFGYLVYPGVYLFFLLFIILIRRINTFQVVQREELKQRLVSLQLQSIKSQLDPHFTFNTLNSVASMIYLEDRQKAYDYLNKFTHLLRSMLSDAEKIYRRLSEEIDFVTTYLELEKLRFGEKFNYSVLVSDTLTRNEMVPKLVLHTFAENAIKHGIMPSPHTGMLFISVDKADGCLRISVEDNGIGRKKSEGLVASTGKGLKLTSEFYEILNTINKKPIKHLITDLLDESGNPAGTRVEVWVPDGLV
jgi:two-component sensor histidine kinase